MLGKLWISLRPTEEELRDYGSRLNYQQLIILKIIEQFGFDQQASFNPPKRESLYTYPLC